MILPIWHRRVPRKLDPASPPPPREYIIRVLIPCYTESLTIVKDVVLAAADALLPEKCKRTVYLLDDGKDAEKAAWVAEQVQQASAWFLLCSSAATASVCSAQATHCQQHNAAPACDVLLCCCWTCHERCACTSLPA